MKIGFLCVTLCILCATLCNFSLFFYALFIRNFCGYSSFILDIDTEELSIGSCVAKPKYYRLSCSVTDPTRMLFQYLKPPLIINFFAISIFRIRILYQVVSGTSFQFQQLQKALHSGSPSSGSYPVGISDFLIEFGRGLKMCIPFNIMCSLLY